jgi:hypothetical protein
MNEPIVGDPVEPNNKVYHMSLPRHRASILQNGLVPTIGKNYAGFWEEWIKPGFELAPAIFANNSEEKYYAFDPERHDLWEIDTTIAPVKWFEDYDIGLPCIMTLEPIPANAIKIIHKAGKGKKV